MNASLLYALQNRSLNKNSLTLPDIKYKILYYFLSSSVSSWIVLSYFSKRMSCNFLLCVKGLGSSSARLRCLRMQGRCTNRLSVHFYLFWRVMRPRSQSRRMNLFSYRLAIVFNISWTMFHAYTWVHKLNLKLYTLF